jgi:hypothetical protein
VFGKTLVGVILDWVFVPLVCVLAQSMIENSGQAVKNQSTLMLQTRN